MFILIAFVFLETKNIEVEQILKLRKSIERIFECRFKTSSSLLSSLSSSTATNPNRNRGHVESGRKTKNLSIFNHRI